MRVVFSVEQAAAELWSYGEDELVDRVLGMSEDDLVKAWRLAGTYWNPDFPLPVQRDKVSLGQVMALACISVLCGQLRPLARERRRPLKSMPAHLRDPAPGPDLSEVYRLVDDD